jgi:hypothetical protein
VAFWKLKCLQDTAIWSAISSPVFQFFGCSILAWSLRQCAPWWQHNAHELSKERHKCLLIRKQLLYLFSHARFGSVYCPCQIWGMGKRPKDPQTQTDTFWAVSFRTQCAMLSSAVQE